MAVYEIKHPLIKHKLGLLREDGISTKSFRELSTEIAMLLTYEATKDIETETQTIKAWSGNTQVEHIKGMKITIVPILRAGLGMLDGVTNLIPSAKISVVGLYRDEETLKPVVYFKKFTSNIHQRQALIVDPMLATGGTMIATIEMLKQARCKSIKALTLVAAPEGIKKVQDLHPDVDIFTAAIDKGLNEDGYILPGLGDAGDKIFGTK